LLITKDYPHILLALNKGLFMSLSSPSQVHRQQFDSDRKKLLLVLIVFIVLTISWTGILDDLSAEFLNNSFINAVVTYGSARAINALVSVIQTATIEGNVIFAGASVNIGQVLDPINDAVERLSDVMAIAIGSIVLQKTLLAISSSLLFKVSLTLAGAALIISSYIKEAPWIQSLSKLFVFLVFIRLSLGAMLLLNLAVDNYYLSEKIDNNQKELTVLESKLDEKQSKTKNDIELEIEKLIDRKNITNAALILISAETVEISKRIVDEEAELNRQIQRLKNDNRTQEISKLSVQKDIKNSKLSLLLDEQTALSIQVNSKDSELDKATSELDFIDKINPLYTNALLDNIKAARSEIKINIEEKVSQISNIKEELQRIKDELRNNVEEISESDDTLLSIASAAVSDSVGSVTNLIFDNNDPFSADPSLDNIKASILEIKNNFEVKESQIEDFQDELMRIEDDINEKEEEISGSVSRIISTATEIALSPLTYLKNQAEVLLDTMILFMMKTVIFPLLFMYLLIKGFKIIWGIDVRALIKREQKLSE
jgi:hypothetical protein|tara:strand:- start:290 stop:1918 length:1629 start_codon:yes stop_codon:yes gene_type:complete